jgi:hypothetical protein
VVRTHVDSDDGYLFQIDCDDAHWRLRYPSLLQIATPEGQEEGDTVQQVYIDSIWSMAGEVAAQCLSSEPSADLSPEQVITANIRGMKSHNLPHPDARLERCFVLWICIVKYLSLALAMQQKSTLWISFSKLPPSLPSLHPLRGSGQNYYGSPLVISDSSNQYAS